jgi:ABC-2 type transport system ATP-binding protein
MSQSIVVVEELTKRFGDFTAVDRVSFAVNLGEVVGYLGPNGSGKTTTLRMLLGLLRPTSGTARVLDCDVARQAEAIRPRVG